MPLVSQVSLGSFGLSRLKWLQKTTAAWGTTAARGTTAAVRHEIACCSAAGCLPRHIHSRNPLWVHDPSVLLPSASLRGAGRIASPALNHWLFTGIAPLCVLEDALPAASCWWKNWQEGLALSQDGLPLWVGSWLGYRRQSRHGTPPARLATLKLY